MIKFKSPHSLSGLDASEPVLLALSGGADSAALLDLLAEHCAACGAKLYAAHVDHMIRENEHRRDREFCESLGKKYGIEVFVLEADVPKLAKESGESLELAARRVRYEFFADIMQKHGIKILATAHNADDNLETLIFNIVRGSGLRGACGIPPVREFLGGIIVRPILESPKSEIIRYCEERGIAYVTDSTNADDAYSRNNIRLNVIPKLKELNPDAVGAASRFCESVSSDYAFIEESACALIERDGSIRIAALLASHEAPVRHALAIAFKNACGAYLERVHIDALVELCKKGKSFSSVSLPASMRGRIENGALRFVPELAEENGDFSEIPLVFGKNVPARHIILYVEAQNNKNVYKSATRVSIASDKIIKGLFVRRREAGDKIKINGMHKDLRKLISEKKIPPEMRDTLPVVCDGEGVLWVPLVGMRDGAQKSSDGEYITLTFERENTPEHGGNK